MVKKQFDSVDLVKFIAAIFIVALHSDLFIEVNTVLNKFVCRGISRLCVPFFFIVSAFFYFSKPLEWSYTKKYCKRLLVLYAAWFIISLPKTIFDRFICSEYPLGETIFRFIRSFFVTSTFSGSWFIVSCIFCALLYFWLSKLSEKLSLIITIFLCVVVYFWITITSAYGKLFLDVFGLRDFYTHYELIFGKPFVSFLVGIPYFGLGKLFVYSYKENGKLLCSKPVCISGCIVSYTLFLLEIIITARNNICESTDCFLMLMPFIFFFFPLIINWNIEIKNAKSFRIASTIVFFSHFLFLFATEITEWALKITVPSYVKFLFALLCSLTLTWIVLKMQDKKGFHWLRFLY